MARGRKSTKVKVMTNRDMRLLKQISNTGLSTIEQAKSHCDLNRDRLVKLEKSGYIKIEKAMKSVEPIITLVIGLIIYPIISTTFKSTTKFAPIIKGKSEGINTLTQIDKPFFAAKIDSFGKLTIPNIKVITIKMGKKKLIICFLLILITYHPSNIGLLY